MTFVPLQSITTPKLNFKINITNFNDLKAQFFWKTLFFRCIVVANERYNIGKKIVAATIE